MNDLFRKECSKFYRKHWKTKHFVLGKSTYTSNILPMARSTKNYQYSVEIFERFHKLI